MSNTQNTEYIRKVEKPFYKKNGFIILAAIVAFGAIGSLIDKNKSTKNANHLNATELVQNEKYNSNSDDILSLKTKLENNIKSLEGDQDFSKTELTIATDFQLVVSLYKAYAISINEGKASNDKEVVKLSQKLEKIVIKSQQKNYPKIRLAYYQILRNKLWENDVYVDIAGANSNIIKFTGSYFATNMNIKETQEALSEMLGLLRFKQTQYRWYKGQDDFTYYNMDVYKDSDIAE